MAGDRQGRIGPRGPYEIVSVAPSPSWTTDGIALAIRKVSFFESDLARTRDGGQSWQTLALPDENADRRILWSAQGPSGRIVFHRSAKSDKGRTSLEFVLSRSTNDGDTWTPVWRGFGYRMSLMVSPTFADDGLLLLQADRHLLRSTDAGQTWTTVALAGKKGTEAVAFSPSYATDRTIVASIAAIDMRDAPIVRPGTNSRTPRPACCSPQTAAPPGARSPSHRPGEDVPTGDPDSALADVRGGRHALRGGARRLAPAVPRPCPDLGRVPLHRPWASLGDDLVSGQGRAGAQAVPDDGPAGALTVVRRGSDGPAGDPSRD